MTHTHLLAAFDVGGSKTDSVLFNERGEILARVKGAGGNPLERGIDNAAAHYAAILNELLRLPAKGDPDSESSIESKKQSTPADLINTASGLLRSLF